MLKNLYTKAGIVERVEVNTLSNTLLDLNYSQVLLLLLFVLYV